MAVHVITKFPAQVALRPSGASNDSSVFGSYQAEVASLPERYATARPATVAIDPLGCMRGIALALGFEAFVVLAGVGVWELWRLLR